MSNTGGAASGALGAAALGAATDFAITADGCMGMLLMPGGNCTATARFQPASVGSKMTTLTVMATPGGSDSATLTGIGQSAAALSAPATQDFGAVTVGGTASADIVITNTGDTVTSALSVTPPTGEYSVVSNGCTGTLAPGASCTIQLRFSPTSTAPAASRLAGDQRHRRGHPHRRAVGHRPGCGPPSDQPAVVGSGRHPAGHQRHHDHLHRDQHRR